MYYRQEKTGLDPFFDFGHKKSVYYYFFEYGMQLGLNMYLASGKENYLGKLRFKNPLYFDGKKFCLYKKIIRADAIYDRSGGLKFPPIALKKILNCFAFKNLCHDKNSMYLLLEKFMPKSIAIKAPFELLPALQSFPEKKVAVLKPAKGLRGKGIFIDLPKNLAKKKIGPEKEYILQRFVDTSGGIQNITKRMHDLRIIIIHGEIILAHLRTPKIGSYLANIAKGGTIKEISLEKIPPQAIKMTKKIQLLIDKKFNYPLYSIDFGFEDKMPYVFELNDQIGFPSEKMSGYVPFIKNLIHSLEKLAISK